MSRDILLEHKLDVIGMFAVHFIIHGLHWFCDMVDIYIVYPTFGDLFSLQIARSCGDQSIGPKGDDDLVRVALDEEILAWALARARAFKYNIELLLTMAKRSGSSGHGSSDGDETVSAPG
jgi:hypothetical protein